MRRRGLQKILWGERQARGVGECVCAGGESDGRYGKGVREGGGGL